MQQGMLSSVLLSASMLLGTPIASAMEMTSSRVEVLLEDEQIHQKVAELLQYAVEDNIDSLNFAIERLTLSQQEVARYLLLKKIEEQSIILTPKMALFVERQTSMVPTYQILERGDGYEFSVPAFNYPSIANRLIKRWKQDQSTLDFVLKAEREELKLKEWLSGSEYQVQTRETLLIRELDSLSPNAINALTSQLTQEAVTSWLPSSAVMVRLAQVSEDSQVYKLLWLMRADFNSQKELSRLGSIADDFSIEQLKIATQNPRLKEKALQALASIKPLNNDIREFLISKMAIKEDAEIVANELARQGYQSWLEELVTSNKKVRSSAITHALSL
ncbi:hypothetical protein [Vibrio japonicus]|uniref:HEAT repeat domain-containing protein n=1 Tax=Vibrio japonicus TaxID=1824638 RepID=A0ABY5LIG8_9VIBR|nr:hypothetical protein [Vibrio japonicus]UUM30694.1 hypothetical protein NP165_00435 [Vibrio japonicus]